MTGTALRCCAALLAALILAFAGHAEAAGFTLSFAAGGHDADGHFMGGTEMRNLTAYQGKLYAGNGYWEDRPGAEGPQGAQILVLEGPQATWRVEHDFDELLPNGRRRNLAISALSAVTFAVDGAGNALPRPVSLLLASAWDLSGARQLFCRDPETGRWSTTLLAQGRPSPNFLPQVRGFGFHRDRESGIDLVFAGDSQGIFAGAYDAARPGRIRWQETPELDASTLSHAGAPGLEGRLRISSFAEADGTLYAAVGQQVYRRLDGTAPRWELSYSNPRAHYSQTGLRGLTAIANPAGDGEVLLAAVEGNTSRIIRIDPRDGSEVIDLDLDAFLDRAWATKVSYVIAAYNDMAKVGDALVIGIEAFIPPKSPRPPGHTILDVVHGLEGGAWYLVRHPDGRYDLHQITADVPGIGRSLVAARTIAASPFPGDGSLFLGGYDANGVGIHNSAWIVRTDAAFALAPAPGVPSR